MPRWSNLPQLPDEPERWCILLDLRECQHMTLTAIAKSWGRKSHQVAAEAEAKARSAQRHGWRCEHPRHWGSEHEVSRWGGSAEVWELWRLAWLQLQSNPAEARRLWDESERLRNRNADAYITAHPEDA